MNNIKIKSRRLRDTISECEQQRSIKHVCVPWAVGIGNSKLEGECTCVARRPKNSPATSGLNEFNHYLRQTHVFQRPYQDTLALYPIHRTFLSYSKLTTPDRRALYRTFIVIHTSR